MLQLHRRSPDDGDRDGDRDRDSDPYTAHTAMTSDPIWSIQGVEMYAEEWESDYNGGTQLFACGGGSRKVSDKPRLTPEEARSAWRPLRARANQDHQDSRDSAEVTPEVTRTETKEELELELLDGLVAPATATRYAEETELGDSETTYRTRVLTPGPGVAIETTYWLPGKGLVRVRETTEGGVEVWSGFVDGVTSRAGSRAVSGEAGSAVRVWRAGRTVYDHRGHITATRLETYLPYLETSRLKTDGG